MAYSCSKHNLKGQVWRTLLAEVIWLSRKANAFVEKADLIESKYLQIISSMRPWDNCTLEDLYGVWAEYALFQYLQKRPSVARELAKRLAIFSLLFKYDQDCPWYSEQVFDCLYALGMFDEAIEYATTVEAKIEQHLEETREKEGDNVAILIHADAEIETPAIALFEDYLGREQDYWLEKIARASRAKEDAARRLRAFEAAVVVIREQTEEAVKRNGGMPIDSFEKQRLIAIEGQISDALSRIDRKNEEDGEDEIED